MCFSLIQPWHIKNCHWKNLQLVSLIDDISPSLDHYDHHHLTEKTWATDKENYSESSGPLLAQSKNGEVYLSADVHE